MPLTVLVVEDDPLVRSYVAAVLEGAALPCRAVETGGEAMRILAESPASMGLLLLDLSLPDMTGMEVAQQAATLSPRLPIVVMSGHSADTLGEALARGSISGYLRKPFLPDQLVDEIKRLLPRDEVPQPSSP